jgi:hypothetical protein
LRELRIEREQFDREHRAAIHAEKVKQERAKTRVGRAKARREEKRNKPYQGDFPKGY